MIIFVVETRTNTVTKLNPIEMRLVGVNIRQYKTRDFLTKELFLHSITLNSHVEQFNLRYASGFHCW
jgi:hypothetical protein